MYSNKTIRPIEIFLTSLVQTGRAGSGCARAARHGRSCTARAVPRQRGRARHRHGRRPAASLDLPPEVAATCAVLKVPERTVRQLFLIFKYLYTNIQK